MAEPALEFTLFLIGKPQKRRIGNRLRDILTELFTETGFRLEVIDLLDHPALAERENIIATPLLVRTNVSPKQYITGDFSNRKRLEQLLTQRG